MSGGREVFQDRLNQLEQPEDHGKQTEDDGKQVRSHREPEGPRALTPGRAMRLPGRMRRQRLSGLERLRRQRLSGRLPVLARFLFQGRLLGWLWRLISGLLTLTLIEILPGT